MDKHTPDAPVIHVVRQGLFRRPVLGDVDILGRRLRREFDLNTRAGERARFCVRGMRGHALVCLDDRILILKSGFYAGSLFGAISATIYYEDVTGIQVGQRLLSGWIEIQSPSFQGRERKRIGSNGTSFDVFSRPNCVPTRRRHAAAHHVALAELRRLVADAKLEHQHPGVVDQLERLAMLRRRGDVDDREFALAKARILDDAVHPVEHDQAYATGS
ncbi:MAG: SHOCT domain-containing protein [Gaiellaceae bacterium]